MNNTSTNIETPFNEEFCSQLEYHLGRTFQNFDDNEIRSYWCDGVSWSPTSDKQLDNKWVNDKRSIVTTAWIGKDGQDKYEMTVKFGNRALRRYAKGTNLLDCIPTEEKTDWIEIDPELKQIEIQLE